MCREAIDVLTRFAMLLAWIGILGFVALRSATGAPIGRMEGPDRVFYGAWRVQCETTSPWLPRDIVTIKRNGRAMGEAIVISADRYRATVLPRSLEPQVGDAVVFDRHATPLAELTRPTAPVAPPSANGIPPRVSYGATPLPDAPVYMGSEHPAAYSGNAVAPSSYDYGSYGMPYSYGYAYGSSYPYVNSYSYGYPYGYGYGYRTYGTNARSGHYPHSFRGPCNTRFGGATHFGGTHFGGGAHAGGTHFGGGTHGGGSGGHGGHR